MNSDIFSEYARIADEHGLFNNTVIKTAAEKEDKGLDVIGLLYGVKPNGKEDDESISDKAHKETMVVTKSYDAMNAVVETPAQRQNIMAHIALKDPTGQLVQQRYAVASSELIQALVRAGSITDISGEEQLMSLADSCAERVSEKTVKTAEVVTLTIVAVALVAGVALAFYAANGPTSAKDVAKNCEWVLETLNSLSSEAYYPEIRAKLEKLRNTALDFSKNKNKFIAANLKEVKSNVEEHGEYIKKFEEYSDMLRDVYSKIPKWVDMIKLAHSKEVEEKQNASYLSSYLNVFNWNQWETLLDRLYGQGNWMTVGRTGGLYQSIKTELEIVSKAANVGESVKPRITEALSQQAPQAPSSTPAPSELPPATSALSYEELMRKIGYGL
jgi:hypothetical protein